MFVKETLQLIEIDGDEQADSKYRAVFVDK